MIRLMWNRKSTKMVERHMGLSLLFLPPYSPGLQPAEHLWQLSDAPLVDRCFASLDDLESVQAERCDWLHDDPDISFDGLLSLVASNYLIVMLYPYLV